MSCPPLLRPSPVRPQFVVDAADVGASLTCLIIGHDNAGRAPAWFLERVEVTHMPTGTITVFTCGEWLDIADGAGRVG